ncbi:STM3941 family protein [Puia dinghuensis]|uniref:Uncharacterized protein n=1 Tax=Puia dinghuensis TaxID=1792502 RepID=A0A8J2UDS6_9BACT|nr:STM3941 family protein [Puia dinghuensis]GGB03921.1 hypothetical protein GCM10011511_29070 [Puia dinghuensis]
MPTNETIILFSKRKLTKLLFFSVGYGLLGLRQIVKKRPGLVIDKTGFTDYSSGLAAGHVSWSDVRGIKIVSLPGHKQRYIAIILKNPHAYLERQSSALKRKAMTLNLRKYGSPVQLSDTSLRCTFDELHYHLQKHFDRSRPYVLN